MRSIANQKEQCNTPGKTLTAGNSAVPASAGSHFCASKRKANPEKISSGSDDQKQ
jgi:hypothetical protein